jgi:nucleotidyltransferase substrate binding protein (TIGR01987 family)
MNHVVKNLSNLKKAYSKFENFRVHLKSEQEQAGAIQAFEYCYELTWKVIKNVLEERGLEVGSPKDTFRKAALEKIIVDPEIWFNFQKIRTITVHTYQEENVAQVLAIFDSFSTEVAYVIKKLEESM